jgi:hypothetical protein
MNICGFEQAAKYIYLKTWKWCYRTKFVCALCISRTIFFLNAHINIFPITIPATWWIGFFSWLYDNSRYSIRQYSEFIKLINLYQSCYHQCYLSILLILQYLFSWVLFYCNCNIAKLPTLGLILQFKCVRVIKSLTWRTHFFFLSIRILTW